VHFKFIEAGKSMIALSLFQEEDIWLLHLLKQMDVKELWVPLLIPDKPWTRNTQHRTGSNY